MSLLTHWGVFLVGFVFGCFWGAKARTCDD